MKRFERNLFYLLLAAVSLGLVYIISKNLVDYGIYESKNKTYTTQKSNNQVVRDNSETWQLSEEQELSFQDLTKNNVDIPSHALMTLAYIRSNNTAPPNYVGGRTFQNREKRLPKLEKGKYKEWDVHPKEKNKNRGVERLVTSSSKAYYTKDHYDTFTQIKE